MLPEFAGSTLKYWTAGWPSGGTLAEWQPNANPSVMQYKDASRIDLVTYSPSGWWANVGWIFSVQRLQERYQILPILC
jgi:hypothetical protein